MKISLGNGGNFGDFPLVWMEGLQMATKMARVPKDAQRFIFLEGKQKSAIYVHLAWLRPANVHPIFRKISKSWFPPKFDKTRLHAAGSERAPGRPKMDFFMLF